jgi:hypothetical protein
MTVLAAAHDARPGSNLSVFFYALLDEQTNCIERSFKYA